MQTNNWTVESIKLQLNLCLPFTLTPLSRGKCYRYYGVWICYYRDPTDPKPYFHFKGYSNGAQLIDRQLWLDNLNELLDGRSKWAIADGIPFKGITKVTVKTDEAYTWTGNPAVSFKTGKGVNGGTAIQKKVYPKHRLPLWGSALELRKEMFK